MEERADTISFHFTKEYPVPATEAVAAERYTRHFTQTEDFFIRFEKAYRIPPFRIHHDYRIRQPDAGYLAALDAVMAELLSLAPDVFAGLTYAFDSQEIFKPCFYKLYATEEGVFLYLLRLDFGYRPHYQVIEERGDNDVSHATRSRSLFLEPLLIPLARTAYEGTRLHDAVIRSLFSETWIGEYGRGYRVQGIWMDNDLTKFFTRLLSAPNLRLYPYYPFLCKYRTVCAFPSGFTEEERRERAVYLGRALSFLEPALSDIQQALKRAEFSEDLPVFRKLKPLVTGLGPEPGAAVRLRAYLNEDGLKEFQLEEDTQPA